MILKPGLYVVSTPIGNTDDITIRALNVLSNSSIIFCEDTRISRKLLVKHGIKAKLQIYNDHSDEEMRIIICRLIDQGEVISLISDAGTPLISDPGYKLVRDLRNLGYYIDAIPGPSSLISALTISGLATDRFLFCGFLPKTVEGKRKIVKEFADINATLIFFETALRLLSSLEVVREILGNREICVARELTKLYQEVKTASINEVIDYYQRNPLKGEIVLLISGTPEEKSQKILEQDLQEFIRLHLTNGLSARTIAQLAYENFSENYSKKEIYKLVNAVKR